MPSEPLTWLAKMPDRLLPMPVDRNQPPMPKPTSFSGASFVTIDRPIGDRHSSPIDWITYTENSAQNGIMPRSSTRLDSANISSANAKPLNSKPRPNLRGMDGFLSFRATQTH